MKNEKGVTLSVLIITILILVILTSILASNSYKSLEISDLSKLNTDIKALEDRVATYYVKNNAIPTLDTEIQKSEIEGSMSDLDANDGDKYYVIDLNALDNPTLTFGKEYTKSDSQDKYIINEETHNIYYLRGIEYNEIIYHTYEN